MHKQGFAVTLGTYDGVHRGHRRIFRALERLSRERDLPTLALCFEEPPKNHLRPKDAVPLLTLPEERRELMLKAGLDRVEFLRFDDAMAEMSPDDFFRHRLLNPFRTRVLCEGEDFGFGRDRRGNIALLEELCLYHKVALEVLPIARTHRQKISSSFIRQLLEEARVEEAARWLGYRYFVAGEVVRGQGLGKRLGFPTANIRIDHRKLLPRGVFAVLAHLPGRTRAVPGACNIGTRPTISPSGHSIHVEAHLIGFSGRLQGKALRLEFVRHIRPERKFPSLQALKRQIQKDIKTAKEG